MARLPVWNGDANKWQSRSIDAALMNAAVYIRKSRQDKDKAAYRLTYQRQHLPEHAKNQGWTVAVYDDGHASAARGKTEDLKERARLESDIRAGRINIVLVIELSRLSRDESLQDYVAWLTLCADHGVRLATTSRILDPAQHSDWMLLLMEGGFSSVEMKVIRGRMAEGRMEAYRKGKWLGGVPPPPYRYDKAGGRPEVDPAQLPKMERIWTLAETLSAKAIAEKLSMPEIAVRRAISDSRLLLYQALREDPNGGDIITCDWAPVMDADRANRIRTARRTRKNNGQRRHAAGLLSNLGLLYCGYCGRTIKTWQNSRIRKDGTRLDYYGCQVKNTAHACPRSRLIPQAALDGRVVTNIFGTLENLEQLKMLWIEEQTRLDPAAGLQALADEEKNLRQKKSRLVSAIAEAVIELADAKPQMADITTGLADIESRRADLLTRAADPPDWTAMTVTQTEFESRPQAEQRDVIRAMLAEIRVYQAYALLTYRFPRSATGSRQARIHLPPATKGRRTVEPTTGKPSRPTNT